MGIRSAAVGAPGMNPGYRPGYNNPGMRPGFNHAFHHRFHDRRFASFAAFGAGPFYDDYYPYDYAYDDGGCYIVRQRVHTRYGWRIRPVQVCG
jgi:hypothetical protein